MLGPPMVRDRLARATVVVGLSVVYLAAVFRLPEGLPVHAGIGDWIDPYFINALLEHWWRSALGLRSPASIPMYFPVRGTLGYSHGLILYAPFYFLVRPILHPFQAYNVTLFLVIETGALCLYALLRRLLRLHFVEALILTALFVTSPNVLDKGVVAWSQRLTVFLLPPILLIGVAAAQSTQRRWRLIGFWWCGCLAALLLTQDFYSGAFAFLVFALLCGGALLLAPAGAIALAARLARAHSREAWAVAFGAAVGALVFLSIYLGAYLEHPMFPMELLLRSITRQDPRRWREWSDVAAALSPFPSMRTFVLVVVLAAAAWVPGLGALGPVRRYALWVLFVSALVVLMPLRFREWSLWIETFHRLPGFSAIRDPRRVIYEYELAATLLVAAFIAYLPPRSTLRLAAIGVTALLIAAAWNGTTFDYRRGNETFDRWVAAPIRIDPACRSFFLLRGSDAYMSRSDQMWSLYGVDATFIALAHGVPTLNGYTAWLAPGWRMTDPQDAGYLAAVDDWIAGQHLTSVCALDIDARTMALYEPRRQM